MTRRERGAALAGALAALAFPAWIVGISFVGVGGLARDVGLPMGAAVLSTPLIFAAPAQVILFSTLAVGGAAAVAAVSVALSAIRLLPMTLSILPQLRRPGQSLATQLLLAHPVAATVWIENMRRLPALDPEDRVPFYAGFAGACIGLCTVMTGIGFLLAGILPKPLAAGLLFLTPIYFTIAMAAGARELGDKLAIVLGLLLAPVAIEIVGRELDLLVAGLVGGTAAYAADRLRRRRFAPRPEPRDG